MSDPSQVSVQAANLLKLEKAYIIILPPSSPAGGLAGAALGLAAAAAVTAAESAAQDSANDSSTSGEAAGFGGSALSSAQSAVGGNVANKITFLFNPQTFTVSRAANWDRSPDPGAMSTSVPQWLGARPRQLSIEIYLDATYSTSGGVQPDVDLLMDCLTPTPVSILMETPSPPFVIFGWGSNIQFLACMTSLQAEYQLFRSDGTPLRAACQITMEEIPINLPSQNPTSGGASRRTRTTVAGDTLQSIAYRELGKPSMWRAIAKVNGISDPMRVAPGTTLLIPSVAEAAEMS